MAITLGIPDAVLTGERYDIDIILNDPLENTLIAGGLTPLNPDELLTQKSPAIELSPMGGGGLFKSVQAPLQPGTQNWAAIIVHPEGLISVTKLVKIVSSPDELNLERI